MEHRFAFPVLLNFRVTGYQLFPGRAEGGIAYDVPPGVSVIAGINGLGKTTLLNMLFRAIVGPRDWKRRRLDQPAGSTPISWMIGKLRRISRHALQTSPSTRLLAWNWPLVMSGSR